MVDTLRDSQVLSMVMSFKFDALFKCPVCTLSGSLYVDCNIRNILLTTSHDVKYVTVDRFGVLAPKIEDNIPVVDLDQSLLSLCVPPSSHHTPTLSFLSSSTPPDPISNPSVCRPRSRTGIQGGCVSLGGMRNRRLSTVDLTLSPC